MQFRAVASADEGTDSRYSCVVREPFFARGGICSILWLALSTLVVSGTASASEPSAVETTADEGASDSTGVDPILVEVGALMQQATEKYNIARYDEAAELWSSAYVKLPAGSDYDGARSLLAYQISDAYKELFKVSGDVGALHRAAQLMESYISTLDDSDAEVKAEAVAELERLNTQIEEEEHAREIERSKLVREMEEKLKETPPEQPAQPPAPPGPVEDRAAKPLQIAGGVTLGVGLGLLGAMAYGLARGEEIDRQGAELLDGGEDLNSTRFSDLDAQGLRANTLAVATGIAGGVLSVTGAILLTVGTVRRGRTKLSAGPAAGPGIRGLSLRVRF